MANQAPRELTVEANGLRFGCLASGEETGRLALCLHGFPDTAWTWRHLLPELAGAGFYAVAPFLRGYAPTEVPADGRYQTGALVADACALHDTLGGRCVPPPRGAPGPPPRRATGGCPRHLVSPVRPAAAQLVHVLLPASPG